MIQTTKRKGDWFTTFTGKRFYPLDPRPEDVCIEDIAHHLSMITRYNGALARFYSVAQHSVFVAQEVNSMNHRGMVGLTHDATEAYVGDMIRPLKYAIKRYRSIEDNVWRKAIAPKFELPMVLPAYIKKIDTIMLATERRDLLPVFNTDYARVRERVEPFDFRIDPLLPSDAERQFLEAYKACCNW